MKPHRREFHVEEITAYDANERAIINDAGEGRGI